MPDICLRQKILFLVLASGKRPRVPPRRCLKGQSKNTLMRIEIYPLTWEMETAERNNWRKAFHDKASFENSRWWRDEASLKKEKLGLSITRTLLHYLTVAADVSEILSISKRRKGLWAPRYSSTSSATDDDHPECWPDGSSLNWTRKAHDKRLWMSSMKPNQSVPCMFQLKRSLP